VYLVEHRFRPQPGGYGVTEEQVAAISPSVGCRSEVVRHMGFDPLGKLFDGHQGSIHEVVPLATIPRSGLAQNPQILGEHTGRRRLVGQQHRRPSDGRSDMPVKITNLIELFLHREGSRWEE
jgi:hypothetical protein